MSHICQCGHHWNDHVHRKGLKSSCTIEIKPEYMIDDDRYYGDGSVFCRCFDFVEAE